MIQVFTFALLLWDGNSIQQVTDNNVGDSRWVVSDLGSHGAVQRVGLSFGYVRACGGAPL